ncbi:hypothetical protein GGI1_22604 [Acidithiobacillus sp. GGI-221]|nr:hypothetical protein GGI1_22604 [Acidithiobacillus sp. GGI-221]
MLYHEKAGWGEGKDMASVIYLMTNVAMPGLVKIGKTDSADTLNARLRDLYNTSRSPAVRVVLCGAGRRRGYP